MNTKEALYYLKLSNHHMVVDREMDIWKIHNDVFYVFDEGQWEPFPGNRFPACFEPFYPVVCNQRQLDIVKAYLKDSPNDSPNNSQDVVDETYWENVKKSMSEIEDLPSE